LPVQPHRAISVVWFRKEYAQNYNTLTDEQANSFIKPLDYS
jgi:hypothetical protein